jgi:hypothetical protein
MNRNLKTVSFNPRRARWLTIALTVILFAATAALVLGAIYLFGIDAVRHGWDRASPFITAVKWGGMFVLIWRWEDVIGWAANRWHVDDAWRTWALRLRWRFAGALVLLELLFGQNLLARLF